MSVKLQTEQQFLGYAGLRPLPDRTTALELTYAIAPDHWGRGLATEAADAVINWGFKTIAGLKEVVALSRHENPASIRVLEKCGFTVCGEDQASSSAGGDEVEEFILRLGANETPEAP